MSLPLKVAATAGVVGGGSLVGCYFGGVFSETPWVSLKVDGASNHSGKVGEKYSIYLLAVHGTENNKHDLNEAKWKELYKKYLANRRNDETKNKMSDEFKADDKVTGAYSKESEGSITKTLNKVCKGVYGKSVSGEVDFSKPDGTENKHKLGRDLLKYCSPLGEVPKKLSSREDFSAEYTSGIGKEKGDELADFSGNNAFWDIKQKQFDGDKETTLKNNKFFKKYIEEGQSIRKICETAYSKTKTSESSATADQPKEEDIVKYCSFTALT